MSYNPYTAPRSTTPPLYYRRPEGVAPSYYTVPAAREVASLNIPPSPRGTAGAGAGGGLGPTAPYPSHAGNPIPAAGVTLQPPTPNAHGGGAWADRFRPSVDGGYPYGGGAQIFPASAGAGSGGRWSYQQPQRQDEEARRMVQLEAEEAAFVAEEAALKAKKTELLGQRRRQEEEQLRLSEGWSTLLEREERYYTEPMPDFSQDIVAREHQCAALHEQLQQADSHRAYLEKQLENYEYVIKDKEAVEKEVARVREGLQGVEQRRRACIARAERFFDVETKRAIAASSAARKLDAQLKDMTSSGPLAQLQSANSASRSQSRGVSFAPADKSVIIDLGRNGSLSTSVSMEPGRGADATQGLSQEEEGGSGLHPSYTHHTKGGNIAGTSLCLGVEDDEEEGGGVGIGGASVAFSFNNSAPDALAKRRRVELAI